MSDRSIQEMQLRGLIAEAAVDPEEIIALIGSAEQGLNGTRPVMASDPVKSVSQMYDALYFACRAFMLSQGYRAAVEGDYMATLRFCQATLDKKEVETLKAFDNAERRRHDEMYDGCFSTTSEDAAVMFTKAKRFMTHIKTALSISR
jgi:uncharacterized protein (UPF0332 family)